MKFLLTAIIIAQICCCVSLQAQDTGRVRRNAVHLSLLGQAGLGSFGYERKLEFLGGKKFEGALGLNVGGYRMLADDHLDQQIIVSPEYSMLFGRKAHHLELGTLLNFYLLMHAGEWRETILDRFHPSVRIGYRYERPGGRSFFRVGIVPAVLYLGEPTLVPWPYLGAGFRF